MNEEGLDSGIGQDQSGSQDAGATQVETPVQNQNSDMVSKQRVNEIVQERMRQASQKAYERGLSEAAQKSQASTMGGMTQHSEADLRRMMQEEFAAQQHKLQDDFRREQVKQQIDQLTNDYLGKLSAAKDKYPDLVNRQEELGEIHTLIPYINESDEAAGITQHLLDNGHNVASLLVLQHTSPNFLRREIQKLAASIKNNDAARDRPRSAEPLYQPTPSAYTADSGNDSIESIKKQPWLRG